MQKVKGPNTASAKRSLSEVIESDGLARLSENEKPNERSKRARTQPNRYGISEHEVNDDAFFEELASTIPLGETENNLDAAHLGQLTLETTEEVLNHNSIIDKSSVGDDNSQKNEKADDNDHNERSAITNYDLMSPGEQILFRKIIELSADVKSLQQSIIEIQTNKHVNSKTATINPADDKEVKALGLPITNETSMQEFEKNLQKTDFYTRVVC